MSYLRRDRKPKRKAAKRPLRAPVHIDLKTESPFARPASVQFDPISNEWNVVDREPTKVTEHGFINHNPPLVKRGLGRISIKFGDDATELNKCNLGWRDEAKDLTLWAKFVKWVRGWHG